ncbi:SDR family oxidoreductase, partial [Arthrospira platensis SPKY2]
TGPSGGLGSVFLDELCGAGWQVLAVSRNAHRLQARPGVVAVDVDLSNASAVKAFISDHRDWLEVADLVINNAGSGILGAAHLQAQSAFEQQVQLMLQSPVALCLTVLPRMLERGRGAILNVTSLAGATGIPYMAAYTTAKAGLTAFT